MGPNRAMANGNTAHNLFENSRSWCQTGPETQPGVQVCPQFCRKNSRFHIVLKSCSLVLQESCLFMFSIRPKTCVILEFPKQNQEKAQVFKEKPLLGSKT